MSQDPKIVCHWGYKRVSHRERHVTMVCPEDPPYRGEPFPGLLLAVCLPFAIVNPGPFFAALIFVLLVKVMF